MYAIERWAVATACSQGVFQAVWLSQEEDRFERGRKVARPGSARGARERGNGRKEERER